MISSAASKDELVLLGLARMFYKFTHAGHLVLGRCVNDLDIHYFYKLIRYKRC